MSRTAQKIVEGAYRKNGIRALNLTAEQRADGLTDLQDMMSNLAVDGIIIPYETTESHVLTVSQASYTYGSGGDINTARPVRVTNAYIRDSSNHDHPLTVISKREYDNIPHKSNSGKPTRLYYDPQYTLGVIYLDCQPSVAYTLFLVTEKPFAELSALSDTVVLPEEYREVLVFNLAIRLSSDINNELAKQVFVVANHSLNRLKDNNAEFRHEKPGSFG